MNLKSAADKKEASEHMEDLEIEKYITESKCGK